MTRQKVRGAYKDWAILVGQKLRGAMMKQLLQGLALQGHLSHVFAHPRAGLQHAEPQVSRTSPDDDNIGGEVRYHEYVTTASCCSIVAVDCAHSTLDCVDRTNVLMMS